MDPELEAIFSDWELLEKENIVYQECRNIAVYLILSFLNLMAYCMRAIVNHFQLQKRKLINNIILLKM